MDNLDIQAVIMVKGGNKNFKPLVVNLVRKGGKNYWMYDMYKTGELSSGASAYWLRQFHHKRKIAKKAGYHMIYRKYKDIKNHINKNSDVINHQCLLATLRVGDLWKS